MTNGERLTDRGFLERPVKIKGGFFRLTPYLLTTDELSDLWNSIGLPENQSGTELKSRENSVHPGDTVFLFGIDLQLSILCAILPKKKSNLIYSSLFDQTGYKVKISCPHN